MLILDLLVGHAAIGLGVDVAIDDDVADKRGVVLIVVYDLLIVLVGEDLVEGGGSWGWGILVLGLEQACCGVGCLLLGV